jgi:hypothetical protein
MIGRLPPPRDFWTEFSAALGYAGLAMMGLQFGLTARFRYVTAPWATSIIFTGGSRWLRSVSSSPIRSSCSPSGLN